MYHHLSRWLYRGLVGILDEDCCRDGDPQSARQELLDACEMTMLRLATDSDYFARPERFLFGSIRTLYPIGAQLSVRRAVERHLAVARVVLEQQRANERPQCAAITRGGTPCRREPTGGDRYCASHRHLACEREVPLSEQPQALAA